MDVSIIITSFNYDKYIEESIKSCLNQETDCKFEIIVVDDGSNDRTKDILSKYSDLCNIFCIKNSGVEAASNIGIKNAKSKYFVRLDADDTLKKNLVETLFNYIENNKLAFAYSNYDSIDEVGDVIASLSLPKFSEDEIFNRGDFLASGTIVNKDIFYKIGGYNEQHKNCGLENYELILKFLNKGFKGGFIEDNLFNYRIHSSNMSLNRRKSLIEYGKDLFKSHGYGEFKTNEFHPFGLKI
ncbi:glycosyltransferase [Gammaproteobacteria bacterium]|nr:glycosyltransferase [Gammaproteobacteria bacterium]